MSRLESSIQRELLALANKHDQVAWMSRANSGSVKVKGGYLQLHPEGTSDLIGFTKSGMFIGIEIKRPETKTQLRLEQEAFQETMRGSNCIHGVAYDKESMLQILNTIV